MSDKFNISREKKSEMIEAIKNYFANEREEMLGDLAATLILHFFMQELATEFYNQGIYDAYRYMSDRIEDVLEIQKY